MMFDLWPVYSGERFRPHGPLVFFFVLNVHVHYRTLANEYPSSNGINKKNSMVRGDCIACIALLNNCIDQVNLLYSAVLCWETLQVLISIKISRNSAFFSGW